MSNKKSTTKQGTIKRLVRGRGFGFVRENNGNTEYFFHRSSVNPDATAFDSMNEGDNVSFVLGSSPKGPRAESVSVE